VTPPGIDPGTFRQVAQRIGGILVLFIYITRLASNEIFSPSNEIHGEVGRAKDFSALLYNLALAISNVKIHSAVFYIDLRHTRMETQADLHAFSVITEELRTSNKEAGLLKCRIKGLQNFSYKRNKKESRPSKAEIEGFQTNVGFKAKSLEHIFIKGFI
jgi:hypothetical protein